MSVFKRHESCCSSLFLSSHNNFLNLIPTTLLTSTLLCFSVNSIRFSGLVPFIAAHRAPIQIAVQLLANLLSAGQILVLCRLVNYGVRHLLARKRSMTMDTLRAWTDIMVPRVDWELPFAKALPVAVFYLLTVLLSGVWAGALTPVEVSKMVNESVAVPSWDNTDLIREYPSEVGLQGPTYQSTKGRFTYSPGVQLLGSLLASASSATPVDGSVRTHAKLDKSRFTYIGRSYGMGSSAGLMDDDLLQNNSVISYSYQEIGYQAGVSCMYNKSSDFHIEKGGSEWIYYARGNLPDSNDGPETSNYVGYYMSRIVAIGVAHFSDAETKSNGTLSPRKYLAFAAGSAYAFLDKVQCEFSFAPTQFNVALNMTERSIIVTPLNDSNVDDIDPKRRLKGTTMRQFEIIANDETNLYVSTVGAAFNASISDLQTFHHSNRTSSSLSDEHIILNAIENSLSAMADDMLGAYAAAQLLVGQLHKLTPATLLVPAIAFGEMRFSILIFVINTIVILLLFVELIRTKAWRDLQGFDPADIRHVVVAAAEGGRELADLVFEQQRRIGDVRIQYSKVGWERFAITAIGSHGTETSRVEVDSFEGESRGLVDLH